MDRGVERGILAQAEKARFASAGAGARGAAALGALVERSEHRRRFFSSTVPNLTTAAQKIQQGGQQTQRECMASIQALLLTPRHVAGLQNLLKSMIIG